MKGINKKLFINPSAVVALLTVLCNGVFVAAITLQSEQLSAQSLGRLFSTPAERAELERRRLRTTRPELVPDEPQFPVPVVELPISFEEEPDIIYALGGTVLHGNGSYTVWINNLAVHQQDLPDNIELLSPFSQGQIRIRNQQSGESFDVKPGQVLNLTTGELLESYQVLPPSVDESMAEDLTDSTVGGRQNTDNVIDLSVDPAQLLEEAESLGEPGQ